MELHVLAQTPLVDNRSRWEFGLNWRTARKYAAAPKTPRTATPAAGGAVRGPARPRGAAAQRAAPTCRRPSCCASLPV